MYCYKTKDNRLEISITKKGTHEIYEDGLDFLGEYSSVTEFIANNAEKFSIDEANNISPLSWVNAIQEYDREIDVQSIVNAIRYSKYQKAQLFGEELSLIQDGRLKEIVIDFLNNAVPDYFWEIPASSSGKYHPSFDLGYGGLVRHTKMVVEVARELLQMEKYDREAREDVVYIACLLHDTFKNGNANAGHTVSSHPSIAADEFYHFAMNKVGEDGGCYIRDQIECIRIAIEGHMGQWGTHHNCDTDSELVHLADYIASRKFFDKFAEVKSDE